MSEQKPPAPVAPEAAPRASGGGWTRPKITLALSGFMLSITLALINAFYAVRGSVIVVEPPEQLILYRDGEGAGAVLSVAMRVSMINAAGGANGDLMRQAALTAWPGGPTLKSQTLMQPVFTDAERAKERCELGARCVALPGLLVIERGDEIMDIPGGQARLRYVSFPAASWNCEGAKAACDGLDDFEALTKRIDGKPADVTVRLTFFADGHRDLTCKTKPINGAYLKKVGWLSLSCLKAKVSGKPLI